MIFEEYSEMVVEELLGLVIFLLFSLWIGQCRVHILFLIRFIVRFESCSELIK